MPPSANRTQTFEADPGYFPSPATKLVVTQHLQVSDNSQEWAWIIVGVFYDSSGQPIWSTEIFSAKLDPEFESDVSETEEGSEIYEVEDEDITYFCE